MGARYVIRLMFEWGGGCIWCGNEAARQQFGVGPIENRLPLSPPIRDRLTEMTVWHDTSLNWDYPPDPGPWCSTHRENFEKAACDLLAIIQRELGPEFEVVYEPV
jgi:hypothetical protein